MSEFIIRHYFPGTDLSPLSRMLTEIESIDRDGEDTSEEYLRGALEWRNYRPAQDVWVAEADGKLAGYGAALEQPSQRCTIYAVVHPSQRRKGLGSQLLELTLARAREVGSKTILVYANEHNSASNLFLRHHGFAIAGSSGSMKAPASLEIPAFEFPKGFTLKRYSEVNNTSVLLYALNQCYMDMWGHGRNDDPTAEEIRSPRFLHYYDADDILLFFDPKNEISGICSVKPEGRRDENGSMVDLLDGPGVIKEYRELGYQRQLVLAGIQHLRKKGMKAIRLEFFGDSEKALDIYRALGFEMANLFIAYHKELP
jgi:mycothiol synthase